MSAPARMLTNSGRLVPLGAPQAGDIALRDVAHHLATINRFAGAPEFPLSVAQHAVLVSVIVHEKTRDPLAALHALHHDDHEAYTGDIIGPMLRLMRLKLHEYGIAEDLVAEIKASFDAVIYPAFGLQWPSPYRQIIDWADLTALATEFRDCMPDTVDAAETARLLAPWKRAVKPLKWDVAELKFIEAHTALCALAGVPAEGRR